MYKDDALPSLRDAHSVTVMVVNLYYTNPSILPVHGFGYLIPRSIPWEQNPECALGVAFDSDSCQAQDTAPGTKVTVMLGGHWWDPFDVYPDADEGAAMAKAVLRRHLNIEEEPALVNVVLQRECIPQYTVGHNERMKAAHYDLAREFNGLLAVAGSSYTGVALNDCVRYARAVSMQVCNAKGDAHVTGLEQFLSEEKFVRGLVKRM
jgi:protoporphyrinogen/coproporphyrinogen III oxidase